MVPRASIRTKPRTGAAHAERVERQAAVTLPVACGAARDAIPRPVVRSHRIAFVTSSRCWRGSSCVFASLGYELAARGHRVLTLVAYEEVASGFRSRGLQALELPTRHTRLEGALALRRALAQWGAEIAFVDMPRDVRFAAFAALGSPLAVIYCISTATPPRDPLTRLAFRRVGLTVFITEELARRGLAAAPFMRRAPYRVIPNGVDCSLFRPERTAGAAFRSRYGLGDGPILVGVGALAPEKRWDLLLESIARLPRPAPPLVLCGRGLMQETLQAQARRLALDVRFIGCLEPAPLVGAYNAATCVVHTCPVETFGLSVAEAMACGRPVLGVAGGTLPSVVADAGVLAPPEDPDAFAALLDALLRDPARCDALGRLAARRARARFSLDAMVSAYGDLVESMA